MNGPLFEEDDACSAAREGGTGFDTTGFAAIGLGAAAIGLGATGFAAIGFDATGFATTAVGAGGGVLAIGFGASLGTGAAPARAAVAETVLGGSGGGALLFAAELVRYSGRFDEPDVAPFGGGDTGGVDGGVASTAAAPDVSV